jgi:adenylate kinase family enzyme
MVKRLMGRGRSDDNVETITKRLRVNQRDAEPVVQYYEQQKKLVKIDCNMPPDRIISPF